MSLGWSDLTAEGKRYFAQLEQLKNLEVKVGYQEGSGEAYENGATLAEVAAYNEFGGSNKPARPFMRQSFENHQAELQKGCDQANLELNKGGTAEKALDELGVMAKGLVQKEIVDGGFAPNSPVTIALKGSSQPLIDTGHMRQSVNYVIKPRGGGK